jgi:Domain of unknown function (DUF4351)
LVAQVQLAGQSIGFLVHLEAQAASQTSFNQRLFFYFAKLHQEYLQRIYPIVIFSFDEPYRPEPNAYTVEFDDLQVLTFNYRVIQLNRLNWRDYLTQPNPVAAALMAKMRIDPAERPKVKAECLRLLATLRLDPARTTLISGFVDTYLRLSEPEEQVFRAEVGRIEPNEREGVMEIVTSWMERGMERGMEREKALILRQLQCQVGELPEALRRRVEDLAIDQLEVLGEALLAFTNLPDLERWLGEK